MAQKLMTPRGYINEVNAFPGSVVEVATAIPAFIGYTEKASKNGNDLLNQPVRITSFQEYLLFFGGEFNPMFTLNPVANGVTTKHEITINGTKREIKYVTDHDAYMFYGIKLFFSNGGEACYIVSVGTYDKPGDVVRVSQDELLAGLQTLEKEPEPTMIVIPDAVKLEAKAYDLYKQVLAHCAMMQNRVAIVDIFDGYKPRIRSSDATIDLITFFREKIGSEYLNYATAYYPWLNTNIVQNDKITFENLDSTVILSSILPELKVPDVLKGYPDIENKFRSELLKDKPTELAAALIADNPDGTTFVTDEKLNASFDEVAFNSLDIEKSKEVKKLLDAYKDNKKRNFHEGLTAVSPTYSNLLDEIRAVINILPPSSAMAGIYTMVDNSRGVWKSPANISLNSVVKPTINITNEEQEDLNVDATSGKSINAIRTFPGIGTLVWGGRTLDGNSLDWKYINVRRTMIMLEQSIKMALQSYVFEPNDANTWDSVRSMIINFLTEKWKQGALTEASPDDAFDVQVGLGATMTGLDILDGKMLVSVKLAIVRPAEFIVVTFEQQMQKS